jgi:S1-C subfamily serine protease
MLMAAGLVPSIARAQRSRRARAAATAPPMLASPPTGVVGLVSRHTLPSRGGTLIQTASCTGFVVPTTNGEQLVATARHCVASSGRITIYDAAHRARVLEAVTPRFGPDVALVATDPAVRWPAVALADSHDLEPGEVLCAWRVRTSGANLYWDRACSRFIRRETVDAGDGPHEMLLIERALRPGFSGGPVMDPTGRVVGIGVATTRDGFDLVEPVEHLDELAEAG